MLAAPPLADPKRCAHARARARKAVRAARAGRRRAPTPAPPLRAGLGRSGPVRRRAAHAARSGAAASALPRPARCRHARPALPTSSAHLLKLAPIDLTPSHKKKLIRRSKLMCVSRQLSQSAPSLPVTAGSKFESANHCAGSRPLSPIGDRVGGRGNASTIGVNGPFFFCGARSDRAPRFSPWARGGGRVSSSRPLRRPRGPGRRATAAARPPKGAQTASQKKSESHLVGQVRNDVT